MLPRRITLVVAMVFLAAPLVVLLHGPASAIRFVQVRLLLGIGGACASGARSGGHYLAKTIHGYSIITTIRAMCMYVRVLLPLVRPLPAMIIALGRRRHRCLRWVALVATLMALLVGPQYLLAQVVAAA